MRRNRHMNHRGSLKSSQPTHLYWPSTSLALSAHRNHTTSQLSTKHDKTQAISGYISDNLYKCKSSQFYDLPERVFLLFRRMLATPLANMSSVTKKQKQKQNLWAFRFCWVLGVLYAQVGCSDHGPGERAKFAAGPPPFPPSSHQGAGHTAHYRWQLHYIFSKRPRNQPHTAWWQVTGVISWNTALFRKMLHASLNKVLELDFDTGVIHKTGIQD